MNQSHATFESLKPGGNDNVSFGPGSAAHAVSGNIFLSPCGAMDSLLKKLIIAAINADSGNVIAFAPACPSFESFKKARMTAGDFERCPGSAKQRGRIAQNDSLFFTTTADGRLNLSRNGSRDCSLRRNFSEEKIPAPNKQPKITQTSNRKDASSAYPK